MDLTQFPLADIPDDGLALSGELPQSVFDLPPEDAKPISPLVYDLQLTRGSDMLYVTGHIEASFQLECSRCLTPFPYTIRIDPFEADIEPDENDKMIHLTDRLREDIILLLPAYPHCDQGNESQECPVGDRFTYLPAESADEATDTPDDPPPGAWDVLENWKSRPNKD